MTDFPGLNGFSGFVNKFVKPQPSTPPVRLGTDPVRLPHRQQQPGGDTFQFSGHVATGSLGRPPFSQTREQIGRIGRLSMEEARKQFKNPHVFSALARGEEFEF